MRAAIAHKVEADEPPERRDREAGDQEAQCP